MIIKIFYNEYDYKKKFNFKTIIYGRIINELIRFNFRFSF